MSDSEEPRSSFFSLSDHAPSVENHSVRTFFQPDEHGGYLGPRSTISWMDLCEDWTKLDPAELCPGPVSEPAQKRISRIIGTQMH